jgi:serine-type D-Ala-D-Ala carboxypeptidase (penicillin-binding protein 5/6)
MANPVVARIVGQPQSNLPVAGTVYNVNYVLGTDGIDGIKTGTAPEAGACYLFAAPQRTSGGQQETVVGAVMGLPTIDLAFQGARSLLTAVRQSLQVRRVASRGQVVARYDAPWGSSSDVVALNDLEVPVFPGERVSARLDAMPLDPPTTPGARVGSLVVEVGMNGYVSRYLVPIETRDAIAEPSTAWRLTRIR